VCSIQPDKDHKL